MSFASPSDNRLVSDIEKLIKTKLELEPLELDEGRARGERFNDGRRSVREHGDDERSSRPARSERTERAERPERPARQAAKPKDPFFEQPYEASTPPDVAPAWEATPKTSARISANIKPKRKVAALFKAGDTEAQAH